ncbi:MAG: hypothetical protein KBS74_06825 [Clostridiales bacterium]|nr:hypothetical protein [Candidatus Cacconaster stercorequi]
MARFQEQAFADFLNCNENRDVICEKLLETFSDNVFMEYGTQVYSGKDKIIEFMDDTHKAISQDFGFTALPVIIVETDDPAYGISPEMRRCAIALKSKLEEYISWYFILYCDRSNGMITSIKATRGENYQFYYDLYDQGKILCAEI